MYEAYWQLNAKPFENSSSPRWYYPSESHQGALLKLRYAVENRRGAALLSGAAGVGKTLLVSSLKRRLPETASPFVQIVFPPASQRDMLSYLAAALDARHDLGSTPTLDESVRRVQRYLTDNASAGRHAVIVVDEAHLLAETDNLETIRQLLNFETESGPAATIILVGQPPLLSAMSRFAALEQRMGVKCLLRNFKEEETSSYIQHRLAAAGARWELFTAPALAALQQLTAGNPRLINRLCDLALLVGFAEEQRQIGPEQIEAVAEELLCVTPD